MSYFCNACANGNIQKVIEIISNGYDVNTMSAYKTTPLHQACFCGNTDIARLLLSNGAKVNEKDVRGNTPLHKACINNQYEIVKLLLNNSANIYAKNNEGITPIMMAQRFKRNNITECLEKENKKRIYILSLIVQNDVFKHYIAKKK